MRTRGVTAAVAAGLSLAGVGTEARAGYPDVFGWTPEVVSHAGAGVADVTTVAAAFVNPAGHAFTDRGMRAFNLSAVASALELQGRHVRIPNPWATSGGFVLRAGREGWLSRHVTVGFGAHFIAGAVAHVIAHYPDQPTFPYYENRTQRLVLLPSVAVRLHESLSVGVTVNFFAGLRGPARVRDGAGREVEGAITQEVYARAAILAGVRFQPSRAWSFGLVYRQRFGVPYQLATETVVGGRAVALSADTEGLYTPDELVAGARLTTGIARWMLDAGWSRWSAWRGPFVQVVQGAPGTNRAPALPDPGLRDTFSARLAGTLSLRYHALRAVELRWGLGVESAMVSEQPGRTNLMDGVRCVVGLGVGVELPPIAGVRLRLSAGGQVHHVPTRTLAKSVSPWAAREASALADEDPVREGFQTRNPGYPSLTGGGEVWTVMGGVEVLL